MKHIRWLPTLLLCAAPAVGADKPKAAPAMPAAPAAPAAPVAPAATADDDAFGPALKNVLPAVVKIHGIAAGSRVSPFGTGVLISAEGHVLTLQSAMLTEDLSRAIQPKVTLPDGRVLPARMHFRSRDLEAAILKIEAKDLPFLKPGDSDKIRAGDWMMLVGNAFNLAAGDEGPSVNLGVLSAVVDHLDASVRVGAGDYHYKGRAFITDANNNPGSYGGPIVDGAGEWIGLIGRIVASNATNTQINYGVPVNELKEFIAAGLARKEPAPDEDFHPTGRTAVKAVVAGYHGIRLFDQGGQLPPPFVDKLDRRSPAKAAGLREDDLIQYVNGKLVQTCGQFVAAMEKLPAGTDVKLSVLRGREAKAPVEVAFKLGEPPK